MKAIKGLMVADLLPDHVCRETGLTGLTGLTIAYCE